STNTIISFQMKLKKLRHSARPQEISMMVSLTLQIINDVFMFKRKA
ncbi:hypothetical protein HMPREF9347_04171, partial [Escherichia coli MS 124-1]